MPASPPVAAGARRPPAAAATAASAAAAAERPAAASEPRTSASAPPPSVLRAIMPRMAAVQEHREQLLRLQGAWDLLALLGPMSGIGSEIGQTRDDFHRLTDDLVASLARQLWQQRLQGLRSRAQVTVDILVRNLFERTADVGFLATDGLLRGFIQAAGAGPSDGASHPQALRTALQARLRAYVRKYSVYDDILLLSPEGRILARLEGDAGCDGQPGADLAAAVLRPGAPYVERFGSSELLGGRTGLIYAAPIADDNGRAAGVLCLSFRLEDEMRGIFAQLLGTAGSADAEADAEPGDTLIALLDGDGRVIASSDRWQLPVGAGLRGLSAGGRSLLRFAGREYLGIAAGSAGYQGYAGPGWQAVAMMPVEWAFRADEPAPQGRGDLAALARAIDTGDIFDAELRAIPGRAQRIQRELARSVWNGRLARDDGGGGATAAAASPAFARTFLEEVSRTGRQIEAVFDQAISRLHTGAITEILDQAGFQARLAVDILDRNLYERANDCRWWALTPALRQALGPAPSRAALDQAGEVLQQINRLYTVYTLLVLFDAGGRIVAVSDPARRGELLGTLLDPGLAQATLALRDPEHYRVAAHRPSSLYGGRPTCVFGAALLDAAGAPAHGMAGWDAAGRNTASSAAGRASGGVAIVFDGAPQFEAMLRDALPPAPDGLPCKGAIALFVSRAGVILASTDARFAVGAHAPAGARVDLRRGASACRVVAIDAVHYAAGICQGNGYREYRQGEAESPDDVAAVLLLPLGPALAGQPETAPTDFTPRRRSSAGDRPAAGARSAAAGHGGGQGSVAAPAAGHRPRRQIAAFRLGSQWFGLDAGDILEVLGSLPLTALPHAPPQVAGLLRHRGRVLPVVDPGVLLAGRPALADGPLLIGRDGGCGPIALRVDALGAVLDIDADDLVPWQPAGRSVPPVELLSGESAGAPALLTVLSIASLGLGSGSAAEVAAATAGVAASPLATACTMG